MVGDNLGTPRMVVDKTGTLSGVKRHDYLPFGEELYAPTGGRTTQQGHVGDQVRQKYTMMERDEETGLDYFIARYYHSTMGRFTSTDPLYLEMSRLSDPQQFNLYNYTRGNPLKYIDPSGYQIRVKGSNPALYLQLLRMGLPFNIDIQGGIVVIVDDKGMPLDAKALEALKATLSGDDLKLFDAITDKLNIGVIDTGSIEANPKLLFGNGQKKHDTNFLDLIDFAMLDGSDNGGGITASDAIKHETLEVYYKVSMNLTFEQAHDYVNKNTKFGGLIPDRASSSDIRSSDGKKVIGLIIEYFIYGKTGKERVTVDLVKPVPVSKPNSDNLKKFNISEVNFIKPKP